MIEITTRRTLNGVFSFLRKTCHVFLFRDFQMQQEWHDHTVFIEEALAALRPYNKQPYDKTNYVQNARTSCPVDCYIGEL